MKCLGFVDDSLESLLHTEKGATMEHKVNNESAVPETDVLSSWKEIAAYLRRGVRTAQRWEAELHMPVYRPGGKTHGAVVAMKPEIDRWIRSHAVQQRELAVARATCLSGDGALSCTQLVASSRLLRADVARNRAMLKDSIESLWRTLATMNAGGSGLLLS